MLNSNLSLDLKSDYIIKELIFINSGSNYYVKLPVSKSAGLYAANNDGKTSTLSAIKLFLLPEINFKRSRERFNFSSGNKVFSDIDSFTYYFPSNESYIICEAENPKFPEGFCWLLFKGPSELSYQRIAVPHPYSFIEHLFWDATSGKNQGIGSLNNDINSGQIRNKLLKDYDGSLFIDRTEISEALYTRVSQQDDHTRYCLLPMVKKASEESVTVIKSLLDIAFNLGNAGTDSLPKAVAAIVEGGVGSSKIGGDAGIFIDLNAHLEEWKDLQEDERKLTVLEEQRPRWDAFRKKTHDYKLLKHLVRNNYINIRKLAENEASVNNRDMSAFTEKEHSLERELRDLSKNSLDKSNKLAALASNIKLIQDDISFKKKSIVEAKEIIDGYKRMKDNDSLTINTIIYLIDNQISLIEERISIITDEVKLISGLERVNQEIKKNIGRRKELDDLLISITNKSGFLKQFEPRTSSVLITLNPLFGNLKSLVDMDAQGVVVNFTDLFSFNEIDGFLYFQGEKLSTYNEYTDDNLKLKYTEERKEISERLIGLEAEKQTLYQSLKKHKEGSGGLEVNKLKQEISLKNETLKKIKSYETFEDELVELTLKLEVIEEEYNRERGDYDKLDKDKEAKGKEYHKHKREGQDIVRLKQELEKIASRLVFMKDYKSAYFSDSEQELGSPENSPQIQRTSPNILINEIDELDKKVVEAEELKENILEQIDSFITNKLIVASPEDKHRYIVLGSLFNKYYVELEGLFDNYSKAKDHFLARLDAHNNTVATSIKTIDYTRDLIDDFIDKTNSKLHSYKISNLDNVKIDPVYHDQYNAAVIAMNQISVTAMTTYPKEMYELIRAFQNNFYDRSSNKLNISKIIKSINYTFNRNGVEERIPQSNGTNSMVNAVLLAILFKEMIPKDLSLSLPVVFDEVGSLDIKNLNEIYNVVVSHGLVLFVATPDPTGAIASVVSISHDLSLFKVLDVEFYNKAESIYISGMEDVLNKGISECELELK